jgi:hypothetical protein
MRKDIQTELNLLNSNKFSTKSITSRDNGKFAALEVNKNQGKKNADSGHMKKIQKLGSSLGGKIGGIITRDNGNLMIATKKANEANKQKYGIRIVAENINTGECWEYISIGEAERDTKTQAPIIRKIMKGLQPKTKTGWIFYKK